MKGLTMIVISVLAVAAAAVGHADSANSTRLQEVVAYGELDLSHMRGVEVLHKKLNRAAKEVCSPLNDRNLRPWWQYRNCVAEALSRAVVELNQPLLTQYHESKNGDASPRLAQR